MIMVNKRDDCITWIKSGRLTEFSRPRLGLKSLRTLQSQGLIPYNLEEPAIEIEKLA